MKNTGQMNPPELKIQGLLDRYLASQRSIGVEVGGPHLDEDHLAAFTEGNLSEREAMPIVAHLADCSFCRHITAELIRLDLALASEPGPVRAASEAAEPTRISAVLNGLLSRIFGTNDGAVFAHNETEGSDETDESKKGREQEDKEQ
ncbi:MAG: zf-HC2 domain-containing protein [Acidobacteriota bacterium]